jgi:hypothetical protein
MESLNCIISHLRGSEIQFIRHYYDFKKTKGFERRGKLFDVIESGKGKTNEAAMRSISCTLSRSAFSQLKALLKDEIMEVLALHESRVKPSLDEDNMPFKSSNYLLAIEVLKDRNLMEQAQEMERKLLDEYRQKELSAEVAILQRNRLNSLDCYLDPLETQKAKIELSKTVDKMNLLYSSTMAWFQSAIPFHKQAERKVAIEHACTHTLPALRAVLETTESVRMERYYHKLAFQCAFEEKDIDQARFHWISLSAAIAKSHVSIGSSRLYLHAFECLLLCESDELKCGTLALEQLGASLQNMKGEGLAVTEQLYFLARSKKKYEVALTVVNFVLDTEAFSQHDELIARWSLYRAGLLLNCGQAGECLRLLRASDLPFRQLDGGYTSSAILELMCMIELEYDSGAESRFGAFSRMVRRRKNDAKGMSQARAKLIMEALRHLVHHRYDFEAASKKCNNALEALSASSQDTSWDEFGQEVVDFGSWFKQRLTRCTTGKLRH